MSAATFHMLRSPALRVLCLVAALAVGFIAEIPHAAAQSSAVEEKAQVADPYQAAVERLQAYIEYEMEAKELPALSVALVDDQEIVWEKGFGMEDPDAEEPATAGTVYRVGSVSKLFTDIAVMQLVEEGQLRLGVPVTRYLSDFRPENPFETSITLRQLMAHRAGLVREPPVGHYFDDSEPSLANTIASLNETRLVYEPTTHVKYSNAGVATVGYVLQKVQGQPFDQYIKQAVLQPMGLDESSFTPTPEIRRELAEAYMWTFGGRRFEAPTFQLGMAPAGTMYAPVTDLGQFISVLFNEGKGPDGQVLAPETIEKMWTPQYGEDEQGFGIGFHISQLGDQRLIGHGGAIYGFATQLSMLPGEKLGVVLATSLDGAGTVVSRLATHALELMRAAKTDRPLPGFTRTEPIASARARKLEGVYSGGGEHVEIIPREGGDRAGEGLWLDYDHTQARLRAAGGDTLIVDDRHAFGTTVVPLSGDRISVDGTVMTRIEDGKPAPAPERWEGLIGEYGWDYNTLYVYEDRGRLHALVEWFFDYPLTEVSRDTFSFPDQGLYHGEQLVFARNGEGQATRATIGGSVAFERRPVGLNEGETFRITPVKPVEELRAEALQAEPPAESGDFRTPDLVDLTTVDSTFKLDIRYAGTNNFLSTRFYKQSKAFMQRPAARALARVQDRLREKGYGLLIHDAYRPWFVTKMFWDATPQDKKNFVANPQNASRHNRGAAVDLTLYDLETGEPVQMVGGYDEFTDRSLPNYVGGTSLQRWRRDLLHDAMEAEGFEVYDYEWWHFDYKNWQQYPAMNKTFEEVLSE